MSKPQHTRTLPSPISYTLRMTPALSRGLVLLLAVLISWGVLHLAAKPLQLLEERLGVWPWQLQPDLSTEQRVVIVAIDEQSLQQIGPWPWSRAILAQLSDRLAAAGVALQAFDLVLPEGREGDVELQQTLARHNALLGQIPLPQSNRVTGVPVHALPLLSAQSQARACAQLPNAQGFLANHAGFSTLATGHIAAQVDVDGAIRHQAPLYCYQGKLYPSLALLSYLKLTGQTQLSWGENQSLSLWQQLWQPAHMLYSDHYELLQLPLSAQGLMRIHYQRHPDGFIYLSAADLLNGTLPKELLQNRLALIGATAFGLGDIVPTPHSGATPGVELQARMIASLLDNQVPYTPKGQWLYQLLVAVLSASSLYLLASRAGQQQNRWARVLLLSAPLWWPALLLGLQGFALLGGLSVLSPQSQPIWLGWLPNSLFAVSAAVLLAALEYLRSRHERQRLYDNLSRYLPEHVASEIALLRPTDAIEAKQQRLLVMSADLRNFTAFQQHHSAEETAQLLHHFFTQAGEVVNQHQGILYELHADSLLAVWPLPDTLLSNVQDGPSVDAQLQSSNSLEQQAVYACQAAQQLHKVLAPLLVTDADNRQGDCSLQDLDLEDEEVAPLGLGVGLSAGQVVAGNLGCAGLRTHMLLGQPVSIALQLQKMTQELAYPILLDATVAEAVRAAQTSSPAEHTASTLKLNDIGRYLLEGMPKPRRLYALPLRETPVTTRSSAEAQSSTSATILPFRGQA